MVKKIHPLILSGLSGLLLFAAWPVSPLSFLIFFAFVPLLWLERQISRGRRFFGWCYLAMLIWNLATTWWVCNSTLVGGMAAILANSLLMCLPWIGFYHIKRTLGSRYGYPALVLFWLSFEYIHLNWELSWPWLTLGNVFASHPGWVQWYEFTGSSGGSVWVLVINVLVFLTMGQLASRSAITATRGAKFFRYPLYILLLIVTPLLLSTLLSASIERQTAATLAATPNVVIVQPDIDPYEKFVAGNQEAELQKLIGLSESMIDNHTALVVWPETAIPVPIPEDEMKTNPFMAPVWDFLRKHPNINLLTGVEGVRIYNEEHKTPTAFMNPEIGKYMDSYNSAALLDSGGFRIYHKSKLVPGVETLPSFLKFMSPLFEKFGGTASGYTGQPERTVLVTSNNAYRIAPAVCYESIYGEFMSAYIRNGADLIAVITNDGWWGNTAGFKQHESYARLRAVENRRWLVRSANTGISCFIDPSGKVINPQPWDATAVIKMAIPANKGLTFYARYGDLLSKIAAAGAILLLIADIVFIIKHRARRG
jgi:apolipoprotein N-acyltransferase